MGINNNRGKQQGRDMKDMEKRDKDKNLGKKTGRGKKLGKRKEAIRRMRKDRRKTKKG